MKNLLLISLLSASAFAQTITYVPSCTRLPCPTKTITLPAGPKGATGATGPQGIPGPIGPAATLPTNLTYSFTLTPAQTQTLCVALVGNASLCTGSSASVTLTVPITLTVTK